MRTTAFVLTGKGAPQKAFELREVDLPQMKDKQVLISVEAFGLNYADVMARKGLYRETPPLPAVIGYEVVGTVTATGKLADPALKGKRVVAFCRFGGYAKDVVTEEHAVAEIGDTDASHALALATQWVTAFYMTEFSAGVRKGEKVLVHAAAGGVGTALVQLCKLKGAEVIAKIGSGSKSQIVRELGADLTVNYRRSDYAQTVKEWLNGARLDVSFNPVAGTTFKKDRQLLGTGGRLILFGGSEMSGKFGLLSTLSFLWKMGLVIPIGLMMGTRTIAGVNMLRVADDKPEVLSYCLQSVVELHRKGVIRTIVQQAYGEADFFRAHSELEAGTTIGKCAVIWNR